MTKSDTRNAQKRPFSQFRRAVLLAGALAICASATAIAAQTAWVDSPGGKVRIVAEPPTADGTIRAALTIDLKPGWTTYWRNPGESGIPPRLGIDGSTNIGAATLRFPPPKTLDEGGVRAIGYDRPVSLPLLLRQSKPGDPSVLKANVFLGVCKNICVPFSGDFSLSIAPEAAGQSSVAAMQVEAAYGRLAEKESPGFGVDSVTPSADGKRLVVTVRLPDRKGAADDPRLFLSGPPGWFFGPPRREGGGEGKARFAIPIVDRPDGGRLTGKPVDIVVTSAGRSVEAIKTVG